MTGEEVANELGEEYKHGYGYVRIRCYNSSFHNNDDRDPSLVIYDGDRGFYCYACGANGSHEWLAKQFGSIIRSTGTHSFKEKEYTQYDLSNVTVDELHGKYLEALERKGFNNKNLFDYKWGVYRGNIKNLYGDGIVIPYYWQGEIVGARLRLLDGPIRFKSLPGSESFPYLFDNVKKKFVFVCEGESDTVTLDMNGYPAIGIPGATNTSSIKKLVDAAKLYGTTLCVVPDNDKAGNDFADRIKKFCDEQSVQYKRLKVPTGKDVNEWYNLVSIKEFKEYIDEHRPIPKDSTHRR